MTAVSGRKKAIKEYLEKITLSVESTNDPETLDRILALLIKADASVTTYDRIDSSPHQKFEKKDKFAPRQKNETQLCFSKNPVILAGSRSTYP